LRARAPLPHVALAVFFDVAQVLTRARAEHTPAAAVDACQLEVDQRRPTALTHDHVLLLVQIVVAHTVRVHGDNQAREVFKKIRRERFGLIERRSLCETTHHSSVRRIERAQRRCVRDQLGDAVQVRKRR